MNQPASKEPTMDEILSSIRQIIADDDQAAASKPGAQAAPAKPAPSPVAAVPDPEPMPEPDPEPSEPQAAAGFAPQGEGMIDPFAEDEDDAVPALNLTADQIVTDDDDEEDDAPAELGSASPVAEPGSAAEGPEPEPAFSPEPEPAFSPEPEPALAAEPEPEPQEQPEAAARPRADAFGRQASFTETPRPAAVPTPEPEPETEDDAAFVAEAGLSDADLVDPEDIEFAPDASQSEPVAEREFAPQHEGSAEAPQRASVAQSAPLPDPDLTSDMAEELLEPAAGEAVRSAFSRLDASRLSAGTGIGTQGMTIEGMLREMLRPMLKEWLDENLPAMVERKVEQEIERVSRGGR